MGWTSSVCPRLSSFVLVCPRLSCLAGGERPERDRPFTSVGGRLSRHSSRLPLGSLRLPLFVAPPNLGSFGPSVGLLCSVCRGPSVGAATASIWGRDGPGTLQKRRTDLKHGTDVSFNLVCHLSKSGVVWALGWLAVFHLLWGDRRVGSDEAPGKEMDPEPFERDGTTRN